MEWCDLRLKLYDYSAAATWRGWPASASSSVRRRLKRFIKQTPLAWRIGVPAPLARSARGRIRGQRHYSLSFYPVEIGRHPRYDAAERGEVARGDAVFGPAVMPRATVSSSLRSRFALAVRKTRTLRRSSSLAHAADQSRFFHGPQRDHGCRFHHADPGRQFTLRESVRDPQHAQEIPLAARHAVWRDAALQQALKGAVRVAHQIAGTQPRRQFHRAARSRRTLISIMPRRRHVVRSDCRGDNT